MKTIAVDLDDTLNDFSFTLRSATFEHHEGYALTQATFAEYLERTRNDKLDASELLSTEYSFFRAKIHLECYRLARPRADGIEFMQWLKRAGWRVVICTHRDLRRSYRITKSWLDENAIPYDHLFMAGNKIVFCKLWGISVLVDDHAFNIEHGGRYGVTVYYPRHSVLPAMIGAGARVFDAFDEVKSWIAV